MQATPLYVRCECKNALFALKFVSFSKLLLYQYGHYDISETRGVFDKGRLLTALWAGPFGWPGTEQRPAHRVVSRFSAKVLKIELGGDL